MLILGLQHIPLPTNSVLNPKVRVQATVPVCTPWNGNACVTVAYAPLFPITDPNTLACMQELVTYVAEQSGLAMGVQVVQLESTPALGK